jgi:hypothetical protein
MKVFREAILPSETLRRDALVASVAQRWTIHPTSAGTTGVPLRFCLRRRFGGTRLSRPWRNVGQFIPLRRARQACPSDFAFGDASEGRACRVRGATLDNSSHFGGHDKYAPPILPSETLRRDALVASVAQRWTIHPTSAGTTGVPLRFCLRRRFGGTRLSRPFQLISGLNVAMLTG